MPELDFPTFPLAETMENNGDGTVTVNSEWIVQLAEYSIRISETENNYRGIKEFYENNKD